MNKNKLKAIMVLNGDRGSDLARALGITHPCFSKKLNDRNGAEFTQSEIQIMKERYNLTAEEIDNIFFNQKIS